MSFFIRKGGAGAKNSLTGGKKKRSFQDGSKSKKFKANKFEDEEIASDGSDIEGRDDVGYESEEDHETAEEKKLRLARIYLQEIEKELDERKEEEEDGVEKRLRDDVDADKGKLRTEISHSLDLDNVRSQMLKDKLHNLAITCVCLSADSTSLYSASKDKGLVKWELPSGQKVHRIKGGNKGDEGSTVGHCHTINCLAVSTDNRYLASGDSNKEIFIWNCDTMERLHIFRGHKAEISGLVFRSGTHTLYSSSFDRSIKIWSVDERSYVETLFGHQDRVMAVDAGARERAVSVGGRDRSARVWKIVEESQLVFNVPTSSIDCVKLLNEEHWVSAGEDGHLAVWAVTRKKPLALVEACHGRDPVNNTPHWVSALTTLYNSDLVVTGSRDGQIRIWSVGEAFKSITQIGSIKVEGFVNSLSVGCEGRLIVAGLGQEHRLGRWWREKDAKNRIGIYSLDLKGS